MTNSVLNEQPAHSVIPKIAITLAATIAASSTNSESVDLGGCSLVGMILPAAFTGATISFMASNDGVNFYAMYTTTGVALSISYTASAWVGIVPSDFAGVKWLKLVSGSTEAAARQIDLIVRDLS